MRLMTASVMAAALLLSSSTAIAGADGAVCVIGRVVDEGGTPVPGARVHLSRWTRPALTRDNAPPADYLTFETDGNGRFEVPESARLRKALGNEAARVWASSGALVSRARGLEIRDRQLDAGKLVLVNRLRVRLSVRGAGAHASGTAVEITLSDSDRRAVDPYGARYALTGSIEENDEFVSDEVPDVDLAIIMVKLKTARSEFVFLEGDVESHRAPGHLSIACDIPPGVRVCGRVLDADGRPAGGVWIVDKRPEQSLPDKGRYVESQETGRFELTGVLEGKSVVLFCAKQKVSADAGGMVLPRVLFVAEVPESGGRAIDLGDVRLPRCRDVRVEVVDELGSPLSGSVVALRRDVALGDSAIRLDSRGRGVIEQLPYGTIHSVTAYVEHPRWGHVEAEAALAADASEMRVRVDGAGMLVLRFLGTGGVPVEVTDPEAQWVGASEGSVFWVGRCRELRRRIPIGGVIDVRVRTGTLPSVTVRSVRVLQDAPTIVDVTWP